MSMHFAPQWVKPIKPAGPSLTPTTESSAQLVKPTNLPTSIVPFPALTQAQRSASPTTTSSTRDPPLSYSRVTHTPQSPSFPTDSSYFPMEPNGTLDSNPHPFRYSRDQILALWDEDKVRETPIELVDMTEAGGVMVSKGAARPVGLRDMTDIEKKLFATSVHPPPPTRRPLSSHPNGNAMDPPSMNGFPTRRTVGPPPSGRDPGPQVNGRVGPFGGFGRGEGGAFGGGVGGKAGTIGGGNLGPPTNEGRMPGALGGGFGGVGKRLGRGRTESGDATAEGPRSTATPIWRPTRTVSGSFEGVLGFGGSVAPPVSEEPPPTSIPDSPEAPSTSSTFDQIANPAPANAVWRDQGVNGVREHPERNREKELDSSLSFGTGGGPGWGTGQRKWRIAAGLAARGEEDRVPHAVDIPLSMNETISESVIATASATPVPERDATVSESTAAQPQRISIGNGRTSSGSISQQPPAEEKEDLGAVQWFYRDPGGQEQGPFLASQMHDWYSHSYFTDDLPLRRAAEIDFHTLSELKVATGNGVQPFLSSVRPRNLPPNLPIPRTALQAALGSPGANDMTDSFRHFGLQNQNILSPSLDTRVNPAAPSQPLQQAFQQAYMPDRNALPPNPFSPPNNINNQLPSPSASYIPSPGQGWGAIGPQSYATRINTGFGSVGMPSPMGSAAISQQSHQSLYSPVAASQNHREARNEIYAPAAGGSSVPSTPWSMPQPSHPTPYQQAFQHQQRPQQPSLPHWQPPPPQAYQAPQSHESPVYQEPMQAAQQELPAEVLIAQNEADLEPGAEDVWDAVEEEPGSSNSELNVETPVQTMTPPAEHPEPTPVNTAVPSVWGQKTTANGTPSASTTRKASLVGPSSIQPPATVTAPATRLPPAPASLPPKPVTTRQTSTSETAVRAVGPLTPEKAASTSKAAPWAVASEEKESRSVPSGPSLREIQDIEAKQAELRKQALAIARAAAGSPATSPATDEPPQNMTFGLPAQGQKSSALALQATNSSPVIPVWGGGEAGPKKTMKQIQEEEEKRKAKVAAQARAVAVATGATQGPKRGYADLAATTTPPMASAGWTTVGTSGKLTPGAAPVTPARTAVPPIPPASIPVKPVVASPSVSKVAKSNGSDEFAAPSVEFIRWSKQALSGLTVNVDDFLQMLLSFPIDPPASSRPEVLEIISDSVYSNSSTLDGRRFAQEFFTRRKADATRPVNIGAKPSTKISSLADVVKTQPKAPASDAGFKVVKAKGKKKA